MALCRCKEHTPQGREHEYIDFRQPVGYGDTSSVCGNPACQNQGLIWLTKEEISEYNNGKRVFAFQSHVTKVKVI